MALKGLEAFSMPIDKISRSSAIIIRHLAKEFPSERLGNGRNGVNDIRRHKWFQVRPSDLIFDFRRALSMINNHTYLYHRASIGMVFRLARLWRLTYPRLTRRLTYTILTFSTIRTTNFSPVIRRMTTAGTESSKKKPTSLQNLLYNKTLPQRQLVEVVML